jgi:hypothetical protein
MPIFSATALAAEGKKGVDFEYDWKAASEANIATPSTSIQRNNENG